VGLAKCLRQRSMKTGLVLWFTGLSGSGKSTLAARVADRLAKDGVHVEALDGDEDRDQNVRRIGFVARLAARSGACAITAAISPYRAIREEVRSLSPHFVEVYTECPIEVLAERDPKGLYKKALAGEIKNFTGVDDPYEAPLAPEVHLHTDRQTPEECEEIIIGRLRDLGYLSTDQTGTRLPPPYGGELVTVPQRALDRELPRIEIGPDAADAALAIGLGYLSPVTGFMPERETEKVIKVGQLERGFTWPAPQVLVVDGRYRKLSPGARVVLVAGGRDIAELTAHEVTEQGDHVVLAGPIGALAPSEDGWISAAEVRAQAQLEGLGEPVAVIETEPPEEAHRAAARAVARASEGLLLLVPSAHAASWRASLPLLDRTLVVTLPGYILRQPEFWPMAAQNVGGARTVVSLLG
jgi:adenylyl-sulfate kinase